MEEIQQKEGRYLEMIIKNTVGTRARLSQNLYLIHIIQISHVESHLVCTRKISVASQKSANTFFGRLRLARFLWHMCLNSIGTSFFFQILIQKNKVPNENWGETMQHTFH